MADYIPITDQEIEPEAPITSVLQHKLRDNPIAIAEGAVGAPILTVWADNLQVATSEHSFNTAQSDFTFIPAGGIYRFNFESQSRENAGTPINPSHSFQDISRLSGSGYVPTRRTTATISTTTIGSPIPTASFYSYYFNSIGLSDIWIYILKNKTTDNIDMFFYYPVHFCFGLDTLQDHPFTDVDDSVYDVFLVNLTKEDHYKVQLGTVPSSDGGYYNKSKLLDSNISIDYYRQKLSMYESFLNLFNIDFNTPEPWFTKPVKTLNPSMSLTGNFPEIVIQQPASVIKVNVSLK